MVLLKTRETALFPGLLEVNEQSEPLRDSKDGCNWEYTVQKWKPKCVVNLIWGSKQNPGVTHNITVSMKTSPL